MLTKIVLCGNYSLLLT